MAKIGPKRDRIASINNVKVERVQYSGKAGKETRKLKRWGTGHLAKDTLKH
jgi:hypothetical protein